MTKIEIEQLSRRSWRVWHEGAVLIDSARDPEPQAARALLSRGITGRLTTYAKGGTVPRLRGGIERLAGVVTVEEPSIRFRRWEPLPPARLELYRSTRQSSCRASLAAV